MKAPKKVKYTEAHSANVKYGMGDHYGTGIKAKVGRVRGNNTGLMKQVPVAKLRKPPKSLA